MDAVGEKRAREEPEPEAAGATEGTVAAASFAPPPEAGAIHTADLWYYRDDGGNEQGPQSSANMRAWFQADYFHQAVEVAASYYGEVPEAFFQIKSLWEDPTSSAFITVSAQVEEAPEVLPEFQPCEIFSGRKEAYVFKSDIFGVGYYLDTPPKIEVTYVELEREKEEQERTRRRLNAAVHFSGEGPS
jgi:hypothetical protein